jgi:hypothetical protein
VLVEVLAEFVDNGEGHGDERQAEHEEGAASPGELPEREREYGGVHRCTR